MVGVHTRGARNSVPGASMVLCIDDDIFFRTDVADRLRRAGWKVVEAGTAEAALEVLHLPVELDLVLANLQTRGFASVVEVLRTAVRKHPAISVAAISEGQDRAPDGERHWHMLLPKPFPASSMVPLLESLRAVPCEAAADQAGRTQGSGSVLAGCAQAAMH